MKPESPESKIRNAKGIFVRASKMCNFDRARWQIGNRKRAFVFSIDIEYYDSRVRKPHDLLKDSRCETALALTGATENCDVSRNEILQVNAHITSAAKIFTEKDGN